MNLREPHSLGRLHAGVRGNMRAVWNPKSIQAEGRAPDMRMQRIILTCALSIVAGAATAQE
jgi:hypothetical protein